MNQTSLQVAQKELAKITDSLRSIAQIVDGKIRSAMTISGTPINSLPQLVVSPKIQIHDSPPPYPVTDEEYETLSAARLAISRSNPILFMIVAEIRPSKEKIALFYGSISVDGPHELKPAKVLAAIQRIIDNPVSFFWLRLAWATSTREIQTIGDMYEGRPESDDQANDPDWWKRGRKPE